MHSEAVSHAKRAIFTLKREFFIQICEKVGAHAPCATRSYVHEGSSLTHLLSRYGMFLQNVLDKVDTWLAFA